MSATRDHQARTAEIPDVDPFDVNTVERARACVYENAQNLQECSDLWRMLGIHPDQQDVADTTVPSYASSAMTYNPTTPPRLQRPLRTESF